jgi:oligoribonuclease NrnB/cAMP/cGMP phosphodiesterase (DHH superfamily)
VNDLFYIYGRDRFIDWTIDQIHACYEPSNIKINDVPFMKVNHEKYSFPQLSVTDRLQLAQKQKDIDIYVEQKSTQVITRYDSFGNKYGIVFADRYFSELGNMLCKKYPMLSYIAMIDISRGTVSYRSIREDINLGTEIAHAYGGGGHPKAAGSTFNKEDIINIICDKLFGSETLSNAVKRHLNENGAEYF